MKKLFCLIILPPIYSVIIGVYKYLKNYKYWDFIIGFIGILSCLVPMDDSIYTYKNFLYYKNLNIKEFIELGLPLYFYIIYFFNKLGISFHQILILINFIILLIWCFIFKKVAKENQSIIILSVLMLNIRGLLDITRYTMANVLFLLLYLTKLKRNKILKIILLVMLVVKIHNAMLVPVILFFFSIILRKIKLERYLIGMLFFIIVLIKFFSMKILLGLQKILSLYSIVLAQKINHYILNNAYKGVLQDNINKGKLILLLLLIFISLIILLKNNFIKNKRIKFIKINLVLFLAILFLFIDNFVIFERYSYTYLSLFIIYLALILKEKWYRGKTMIKIFILFILMINIYNNAAYFRKFYIKKEAITLVKNYSGTENLIKVLYLPTAYLLIKDNFENEWFEKWRNNE